MDPPLKPELTERLEEIRRSIQLDIDNVNYCASNQSLADFFDRVSETISEIDPHLLERFDASLKNDKHNYCLLWVKVLIHAEDIAINERATELIERFLEGVETATYDEQMKVARTVMRDRRDVLHKLAK